MARKLIIGDDRDHILVAGQVEDRFLTPAEVAAEFRVSPGTITRWDNAGRFPDGAVIRTPGGHRRIRASAVTRLLGEPS